MNYLKKYYELYEQDQNFNIDFESATVAKLIFIQNKWDFKQFEIHEKSKSFAFKLKYFFSKKKTVLTLFLLASMFSFSQITTNDLKDIANNDLKIVKDFKFEYDENSKTFYSKKKSKEVITKFQTETQNAACYYITDESTFNRLVREIEPKEEDLIKQYKKGYFSIKNYSRLDYNYEIVVYERKKVKDFYLTLLYTRQE